MSNALVIGPFVLPYALLFMFDVKGRLVSMQIGELSAATLNEKLQTLTQQ